MDIHKFGGVSTSNSAGINRIFEIISAAERPVMFTVSAKYGITNYLHDILNKLPTEDDIPGIICYLEDSHISLISEKKITALSAELSKLERLLYGIAYTGELTSRSKDIVLSFGERLISIIIHEYFKINGVKIKIVDPEHLIVTNGVHYSSKILLNDTEVLCSNYNTNEHDIILVPGYYGVSKNKRTTLLGRSGTDYSATSLGYGFNATSVIIWKNVLGFMTADPKIVKKARTISELSYDEAAELSYFGAKILHAQSVIPCKLKGIPIYIKNLEDEGIYTKIHRYSNGFGNVVKSVSHSSDLAIIRIYKYSGGVSHGSFSTIADRLQQADTNILSIATSQTCISVLVGKDDIDKSIESLEQLKNDFIEAIECERDIALLCIVGEGLGNTPGIASKVFNSISDKNINVVMISSGASKVAFHFTVPQKDLNNALIAIHSEFYSE